MRPEVELLLYCANTSIDTARTEKVRGLLRTDLDWAYILQTAGRHGVTPLLSRSLQTISPNDVPQAILEQLQHHSRANAAHNLFLTNELLKILKLLEAHVIPALPYKGPLLTASIYGNLALRDFADLDILVHEQNYQQAQRLLSTHGYQPLNAFEQESTFLDGSGRVTVDLHKRMTSREFPSPLQFEQIWKRRQQTTILSTKVPTLSPEDTLLMLAIQMTKDAGTPYLQLARICDIAQLLRTYPDLDLIRILRQSKELGGERMVLFSLCLANHLLDTPLLQEVSDKVRAQPTIDQLAELTCQQLFDDRAPSATDRRSIDHFRWLVRERLRDKLYPYYLRYVLATFVPCTLDRQLLPLPQRLAFLYYGIRPIRLLYKYGSLFFARHLGRAVR
ncbi:MAG: nucleotidyltransferase family protein [Nitrospira sp.]